MSFLGLGVPITEPSLGLLIANGYQYMLSGKYWISFYPGIALLATIMPINLVGDQLRDVLNPRLTVFDDHRPPLELRTLRTHFFTRAGVVKAVDDVSFSVSPGQVLGSWESRLGENRHRVFHHWPGRPPWPGCRRHPIRFRAGTSRSFPNAKCGHCGATASP